MYSARDDLSAGFPHSEIFGSKPVCGLPEAYRTLQRPSSPVIAKASTTCTYSLDPITLTPRKRRGYKNRTQVFVCQPTPSRQQHRLDAITPFIPASPHVYNVQVHQNYYFTSSRFLKNAQPFWPKDQSETSAAPQPRGFVWLCLLLVKVMVEVDGIEPTTPCLQSRCSPS